VEEAKLKSLPKAVQRVLVAGILGKVADDLLVGNTTLDEVTENDDLFIFKIGGGVTIEVLHLSKKKTPKKKVAKK